MKIILLLTMLTLLISNIIYARSPSIELPKYKSKSKVPPKLKIFCKLISALTNNKHTPYFTKRKSQDLWLLESSNQGLERIRSNHAFQDQLTAEIMTSNKNYNNGFLFTKTEIKEINCKTDDRPNKFIYLKTFDKLCSKKIKEQLIKKLVQKSAINNLLKKLNSLESLKNCYDTVALIAIKNIPHNAPEKLLPLVAPKGDYIRNKTPRKSQNKIDKTKKTTEQSIIVK